MLPRGGLCGARRRLRGRTMMMPMRRVQQTITSRLQRGSTMRDGTVARSAGVLRVIVLPACSRYFMVPVVPVIMMMMMVMMTPRRRRRGRWRCLKVDTSSGGSRFVRAPNLLRKRKSKRRETHETRDVGRAVVVRQLSLPVSEPNSDSLDD